MSKNFKNKNLKTTSKNSFTGMSNKKLQNFRQARHKLRGPEQLTGRFWLRLRTLPGSVDRHHSVKKKV